MIGTWKIVKKIFEVSGILKVDTFRSFVRFEVTCENENDHP